MAHPVRYLDTDSGTLVTGAAPRDRPADDHPPDEAEVIELEVSEANSEGGLGSMEETGRLIQQYVQELRQELGSDFPPPSQPIAARRLIWALGLGTIATAMIVFGILWHHMQTLSAAGQRAMQQEYAVCVDRQAQVMRSIADYTREHHEAPPDLTALWPRYLRDPPVDPTTGEAFKYAHEGTMVTLLCPHHPLAPLQPLPETAPPSRQRPDPRE
jgi:hypothetical protein